MSAVVVIAPIVVASWPVLAAAVVSAAASAGFRVVRKEEPKLRMVKNSVELDMENSDVVADSLSPDQQMVVERNGIRVSFSRDARGHFKTCAEGDASKEELRKVGEDLSGRVIQQYVYRRLSQELGQSGFSTVSEEKAPDGAIRLHVRRYQE